MIEISGPARKDFRPNSARLEEFKDSVGPAHSQIADISNSERHLGECFGHTNVFLVVDYGY